MTRECMEEVVKRLQHDGFIAGLEYPGFISVELGGDTFHFGDANETLTGDVYRTAELASAEAYRFVECDLDSRTSEPGIVYEAILGMLPRAMIRCFYCDHSREDVLMLARGDGVTDPQCCGDSTPVPATTEAA